MLGDEDEDYELNAKYAISIARKFGCTIFMVWEHIVNVKLVSIHISRLIPKCSWSTLQV